MKRSQLEKMQVGDCFAKKSRFKTTIFRIKRISPDYYWGTDMMIFSREGIKAETDIPWNGLYSDGFVPIGHDEFDRIWRVVTMTQTAIRPLLQGICDRIEEAKR